MVGGQTTFQKLPKMSTGPIKLEKNSNGKQNYYLLKLIANSSCVTSVEFC